MDKIYAPKNYYRRVRTLLKTLKAPEINQPLNIQRSLSIFRSALRLGVFGEERFHYWALMFWTLPRLLGVILSALAVGPIKTNAMARDMAIK